MEQVLSLLWVSKDLRNHQLHGGKAFKFSCHKICGRYFKLNITILININKQCYQHHKIDQHGELTLDIFDMRKTKKKKKK